MNTMHIVEYDEVANQIEEVKEMANFLPDVSTDEGYQKSKRVALDIGKLKTALEKTRKEKKEYFIEGGRQVDSQAKKIAAQLDEIQAPHKEAYKLLDEQKKKREQERKEELEERVRVMRELPDALADSSSEEIMTAMNGLQKNECLDFYEYTEQALKARNASKEALAKLFTKKQKEEQDAIELERLRREQEERARLEREEAIRKEASMKAEKEKREAEEREKKAKEEALLQKERALQAEKDRIEQEEKAKKDAEEAMVQAEKNAQAAAEKAKQDEIARQEAERKREAEELAKREANKKHIGKIRGEAKDCLMSIGVEETMAKKIVLAISNNEIKNVSINY